MIYLSILRVQLIVPPNTDADILLNTGKGGGGLATKPPLVNEQSEQEKGPTLRFCSV